MLVALAMAATLAATLGAPCRTVHGRAFQANGAPAVRIAVIGSRRILGVVQPNESFDDLPAALREIWGRTPGEPGPRVLGDFRVCPVTPARAGRMQMVRLTGAAHLVAQRP
jgi:hypothetical protein